MLNRTSEVDANTIVHENICGTNTNGGCPVTLCIKERSKTSEKHPECKYYFRYFTHLQEMGLIIVINKWVNNYFLTTISGLENHELMPLKCLKHPTPGLQQSKEIATVDISRIHLQNLETNDHKSG